VQGGKESARHRHPFVSVGKSTCTFRHLLEESSISTRDGNGAGDKDSRAKNSVIVRNQFDMPIASSVKPPNRSQGRRPAPVRPEPRDRYRGSQPSLCDVSKGLGWLALTLDCPPLSIFACSRTYESQNITDLPFLSANGFIPGKNEENSGMVPEFPPMFPPNHRCGSQISDSSSILCCFISVEWTYVRVKCRTIVSDMCFPSVVFHIPSYRVLVAIWQEMAGAFRAGIAAFRPVISTTTDLLLPFRFDIMSPRSLVSRVPAQFRAVSKMSSSLFLISKCYLLKILCHGRHLQCSVPVFGA
jgi:hypothetical protein